EVRRGLGLRQRPGQVHRAGRQRNEARSGQAAARREALRRRQGQAAQGRQRRLRLAAAAGRGRSPPQGREGRPGRREVTMRRAFFIISLLALAAATSGTGIRSTATAADSSASPTGGAVVFASNRDGDSDLYAVNTDGSGLTRLTNTPGDDYDPLPSPDG